MYIIDKGTGYPEPMNALGKTGDELPSVNFWSPAYPGKSALGGYVGAQARLFSPFARRKSLAD